MFSYHLLDFKIHLDPHKNDKVKKKFYIWSFGYQNRVTRVSGVNIRRHFLEILKNSDFRFEIFEKGQMLRPFHA